MSKTDKARRPYATVAETKAGDMLEADGDFTCIAEGTVLVVKHASGGLYVDCCNGQHGLDGQIKGKVYLGLYRARAN